MEKMKDLIDRRALIKEFSDFVRASNNSDFTPMPTWNDAVSLVKSMPPVQQDLTYIIFETLAECGIYGEEATIKLIGTLKRLGRNDLLPPCVR